MSFTAYETSICIYSINHQNGNPMLSENTSLSDLDQTKDRVIVGNNAKFIYDHIKSLENEPEHRKRWIWELLQNAQDTSRGTRVNVEICFDGKHVSFSHDGPAFTLDDITHLIFHGSSKPEKEGKTGKFGTGFMTTHLLSKEVRIQGSIQDGRAFDFLLDRRGQDAAEMNVSLDSSWNDFKASLNSDKSFSQTTFTYLNLSIPDGVEIVKNVLSNIHLLIPAVLAFSDGIGRVQIEQSGATEIYERDPNSDGHKVIITRHKEGEDEKPFHFLLRSFRDGKSKIGLPITPAGAIEMLEERIPRLFIVFPLIGTEEAFRTPFLIHSPEFEPSKEREKLWLAKDSKTTETLSNKTILEESFQAYIIWAKELLEQQIDQTYLLANLGLLPQVGWVDTDWYQEQLNKLILALDELPLIQPVLGEKISLQGAYVPCAEGREEGDEANHVWRLASILAPKKTPKEDKAEYWRMILYQRESFLKGSVHPAAFTIQDVCGYIDQLENKTLDGLSLTGETALQFLQDLVNDLQTFKQEKYWSDYAILPNQRGSLKKSWELKQELLNNPEEIGEALKDIAKGFDLPGKDMLLHPLIRISSENHQLAQFKKSEMIAALVAKAKSLSYDQAGSLAATTCVQLFEWLLQNDRINDLTGYPIKMNNQKWDKLQSGREEPFLCPIAVWKTPFQPFADLFPSEFILSEEYASILSDPIIRHKTIQNGWFIRQPLYSGNQVLSGEDLVILATRKADKDALAKGGEATEWKMSSELSLSQIAYLTLPQNKSVIDKARNSGKGTTDLLKFVIEVLLMEDITGFSRTEIIASNGDITQKIGIYPSRWLAALKRRSWVKMQGSSSSSFPSVESFLPYFDKKNGRLDLYSSLLRNEVSRFLHFLGIGVGDLLRNIRAEGEDERIDWDRSYVSILMNPNLTPEKVTTLLSDPDFIRAFEDKKAKDDLRADNQKVGADVEKMFEQVFLEQPGFSIERDAVGSDYALETDVPNLLLVNSSNPQKFVVEIKSTRTNQVAMTVRQGIRACDPKENYILCVVPLIGKEIDQTSIRAKARFVLNIGELLKDRVEKVSELREKTDQALQPGANSDKIITAIEGGNIRYVILGKVWQAPVPHVFSFDEFVNGLSGSPFQTIRQ